MNNLLWHQLKISISIAYSFDNFWLYFLENLSILFPSCTINFYIQLTIVFVNFVYSFCQFCAWIFLFFLHPIYTQSLWLLLQNSAYLYKQIMNRIHMDLYELKWQLLMKEGGLHCNIECKSLKKWSCLFSCIWVKLGCIIRPVYAKKLIKSKVWLHIIFALHSNFWFSEFGSQVALQKVPFKFLLPLLRYIDQCFCTELSGLALAILVNYW